MPAHLRFFDETTTNTTTSARCPQSSTPEQQPINIIGVINIVEATQYSCHNIAIMKVEWWHDA
jgi:hypothetical protein